MLRKWDVLTPLGIGVGATIIFLAISMSSSMGIFISLSSFMITIGGSFCALLVNYRWEQILMVFKSLKKLVLVESIDKEELIDIFLVLARKGRKEGLLALEDDIEIIDDRFFQKGLRLVVDAVDKQEIEGILETDIEATAFRHEMGQNVFRTWGTFCPAFGMIGTLIGLIQMLVKLEDPSALGPSMALALITTFYGALLANLVLLPIAGKLELLTEQEFFNRRIIMDGIMSIQRGINPRILEERLNSYLKYNNNGGKSEGVLNV